MSKRNLLFLALLLSAVPLFAQFRAGSKLGANYSNIHQNMNSVELNAYNPRFGVHGGLMGEYMFSPRIGLHSELTYYFSGAAINPDKYRMWFDVYEEYGLGGYIGMHTLQLPVYIKTKFVVNEKIKLYVMGGGVASYAVTANQQIKLTYQNESIKLKWSLYEKEVYMIDRLEINAHLQQRWSAGVAAEAGIELINGLTVGGGFRQVLTNMAAYNIVYGANSIKPNTKMWSATVSIGYFF